MHISSHALSSSAMLRSLHTPVLSCIYNMLIRTQRKFILQGRFRNSSIIFYCYFTVICVLCTNGICVLVCACVYLYVLVRACMCLCVFVCTCACLNVLLCTCMCLYVLVCAVSQYIHVFTCVCVYMDGRAGRPNTAHTESAGTGVLPTTILNDYLMRYDYLQTSIAV